MKFFISLILIAALSFAACLYLPWWIIAVAGFLVAVAIPQGAGWSFLSGFLAVFILWAGMSFWISSANDHLLAHKISPLIIKIDNPVLLILATGLIGGLVAGLGALTGSFVRRRRKVESQSRL
ncbi:MAG: hypothetical protein WKF88_07065 [Ferruginibacter sp.]